MNAPTPERFSAIPRLTSPSNGAAELDGRSWKAGLAIESHGVRIGLRCDEPSIIYSLLPQLLPDWTPYRLPWVDELFSICSAPGPQYDLYLGSERLFHADSLALLLDRLNSDIHHRVALRATDGLFIHAGVVGWKGYAIVMPGRSRSGKSTMVRALIESGATYYSDEYAVVDSNGAIHPYAKPLSLRDPQAATRRFCPAEELGAVTGKDPLPLGLLLVMHFRSDATWIPQPLSPGEACLALLDNTVLARARPDAALHRFARALTQSVAFHGERGEADEVVRWVLQR